VATEGVVMFGGGVQEDGIVVAGMEAPDIITHRIISSVNLLPHYANIYADLPVTNRKSETQDHVIQHPPAFTPTILAVIVSSPSRRYHTLSAHSQVQS
jgi:hypothetical protein